MASSTTSFPTVSPLGDASLHPSPSTTEVQVRGGLNVPTDVLVSDLTTNLEADQRQAGHSDSSSCGEPAEGGTPFANWVNPFTPDDGLLIDPADGNHSRDTPNNNNGRTSPSQGAPPRRCVLLSQLGEAVRAADVHSQCSQFGPVERVYMPRKTAHPTHGLTAFVTMGTEALAQDVLEAFIGAGFDAQLTHPPYMRRTRKARRSSIASFQTSDSRTSGTQATHHHHRSPISLDDAIRRGNERRRAYEAATASRSTTAAGGAAPPPGSSAAAFRPPAGPGAPRPPLHPNPHSNPTTQPPVLGLPSFDEPQ